MKLRSLMLTLACILISISISADRSVSAQVVLVSSTAVGNTGKTKPISTVGANLILACEAGPYGAQPPVDSAGNAYQLLVSAPNPGYWALYLYASFNPKTSAAETFSANNGGYPVAVQAYKGVAGFDKASISYQKYPLRLSLAPTNGNELVMACVTPESLPAGMTVAGSAGAKDGISGAYVVQTAAAPSSITWTEPASYFGAPDAGLMASFFSQLSPASLISRPVLPEGFVGQPYNYQIPIAGGVAPYKVAPPTLPAGLSVSAGGLITGTPKATVSSAVSFAITDAQGHTLTTRSGPVVIAARPLAFNNTRCPGGTQYQPYAGCQMGATGGTPPYTFTWAGEVPWTGQQPPANGNWGALPEGLTESASGSITGTVVGQGQYIPLFLVTDAAGATIQTNVTFNINGENSLSGCSFPADSIFYVDVSKLPVDTSPAAAITPVFQPSRIRIGFGQYGNGPNGLPFTKVPWNQPMVSVNTGGNPFPNGRGPIPVNAAMEGTRNGPGNKDPSSKLSPIQTYNGDSHVLVLQTAGGGSGCKEYSLYDTYPNVPPGATSWSQADGTWGSGLTTDPGSGYSSGYFDMGGYNLVPAKGEQDADAAGLPIIPLLENADEVIGTGTPSSPKGVIGEMKRFTLNHTLHNFVWPATHQAGQGGCKDAAGKDVPAGLLSQLRPPATCAGSAVISPLGEIYRLKASVPDPGCMASSPQAKIIADGFRKHGIILADNGGSGFLIGTPDPRWNMADLACLASFTLANFEPVMVQQLAVRWPRSSQVTGGAGTPSAPPKR